jgi:hypothetical protein
MAIERTLRSDFYNPDQTEIDNFLKSVRTFLETSDSGIAINQKQASEKLHADDPEQPLPHPEQEPLEYSGITAIELGSASESDILKWLEALESKQRVARIFV